MLLFEKSCKMVRLLPNSSKDSNVSPPEAALTMGNPNFFPGLKQGTSCVLV